MSRNKTYYQQHPGGDGPECGTHTCACFDDDDQSEVEDDGLDECGMTPSGQCMLAVTESCDWGCPRNRPAAAPTTELDGDKA